MHTHRTSVRPSVRPSVRARSLSLSSPAFRAQVGHLLFDAATRHLHAGWLKWIQWVTDERAREKSEEHAAALRAKHAQHTASSLIAVFVNREGRIKLMAWRSWIEALVKLREAELRRAHATEVRAAAPAR